MRIMNRTKKAVLSENSVVARTFAEKVTGLLGSNEPKAMVFKTRWGMHTIGMRFSIDCVVCDTHGCVRAVRKNLPPGRFFIWNPFWNLLIEFPSGTIKATGTVVGDELEFSEVV